MARKAEFSISGQNIMAELAENVNKRLGEGLILVG